MDQVSEAVRDTQGYKYDADEDLNRVWRYMSRPQPEAGRSLPAPSRDPAELKKDLDTHGYCFVANALSEAEVQALRGRVREQFAGEDALGRAHYSPYGDERLTNLLMKGPIFQRCLADPLVDQLVEHLLDDSFLLSTLSSVTTKPGSTAQGLHIDQSYLGFPTPMASVCNAVWMLNDFTDENGGTRVIPGSHLWSPEETEARHEGLGPAGGDGLENPPGTIAAEAPAGACMVFDGRLLHGTGRNRSTDQTRSAVFAYYCRPFIRQFENPFLSISDEVMMELSPAIRRQLGYQPWAFTGGCESPGAPAPLDVVRPKTHLGVLTA